MTTHHQRVDVSASSVLAICTCEWREMAMSVDNAWEIAADHAWAVHDDGRRARQAAGATRRRRSA